MTARNGKYLVRRPDDSSHLLPRTYQLLQQELYPTRVVYIYATSPIVLNACIAEAAPCSGLPSTLTVFSRIHEPPGTCTRQES